MTARMGMDFREIASGVVFLSPMGFTMFAPGVAINVYASSNAQVQPVGPSQVNVDIPPQGIPLHSKMKVFGNGNEAIYIAAGPLTEIAPDEFTANYLLYGPWQ